LLRLGTEYRALPSCILTLIYQRRRFLQVNTYHLPIIDDETEEFPRARIKWNRKVRIGSLLVRYPYTDILDFDEEDLGQEVPRPDEW
jgi:hypothetical protein